jgi:hypothetical protein
MPRPFPLPCPLHMAEVLVEEVLFGRHRAGDRPIACVAGCGGDRGGAWSRLVVFLTRTLAWAGRAEPASARTKGDTSRHRRARSAERGGLKDTGCEGWCWAQGLSFDRYVLVFFGLSVRSGRSSGVTG